jgi:alanyl-tRNA synthetase
VLGVKSEAITYKEGVWSGGGNAGPCFEAVIDGLEVCTLVFMQYKVAEGQLREMPLKVVDTGYGIERYAWLSQGEPSGFHTIYGSLLDKLMSLAGVRDVDERILVESARFSAIMKVESTSDRMALRRKVAEQVGMDPLELDRIMAPIESVYAVADHTKAIAFMLAEGVVPSNVKAGYLVRLLVRRTCRLLRSLGIEERLLDIVDEQISFWAPVFPHLAGMRGEILEALSAEERKYRSTLRRGVELTRKIAKELKARGREEIGGEMLAELYDSHGVPPEVVVEAAGEEGVKATIPDNFYTLIAARHQAPLPIKEDVEDAGLEAMLADLPETKLIYYEEPYTQEFKARILKVIGQKVVLDRTAFYPGGGGQHCDFGILDLGGRGSRIIDVKKVGKVVIHTVDGQPPAEGQEVTGIVDWDRRLSLMRHHTSTHIMLGAARRVLGQHAWQAGAEKEQTRSRLDISHWERITPEQLTKIEYVANQQVMKCIPIEVQWLPRGVAESLYGFILYQGGIVPGSVIRVVKIGDWDVEACGGLHLRSTGEAGLIKIIHTERIQDGVERIVFASGDHALDYVQKVESQVKEAAEALSVPPEQLGRAVHGLADRLRVLEKEVGKLRERIVCYGLEEAARKSETLNGVRLATGIFEDAAPETLISAASKLVKEAPDLVIAMFSVGIKANVIVMAGNEAVGRGVDSGALAAEAARVLGGGGGGRPSFGQGGGANADMVEDALKRVYETVARQVRGK